MSYMHYAASMLDTRNYQTTEKVFTLIDCNSFYASC